MNAFSDSLALVSRLNDQDLAKFETLLGDALDIVYKNVTDKAPSEVLASHEHLFGALALQSCAKVERRKRLLHLA